MNYKIRTSIQVVYSYTVVLVSDVLHFQDNSS